MLIHFQEYLTLINIYLWTNIGILPFWLMILFFPNSRIVQIFTNSIIVPLFLSAAYVYVIYHAVVSDEFMFDVFSLYFSLDNLYAIFSTESFLLAFWLHFVFLNLFLGTWTSRDAVKYNISRKLVFVPLIFIFFVGPIGLVLYWSIRIFYAKKLGFHD